MIKLIKEYGSVKFKGKLYALKQNAYQETEETYASSAIDEEGKEYIELF